MKILLPRTPSFRDQEIYRYYHSKGQDQDELAKKHQISQQRVSQILKRVELWIGTHLPSSHDLSPEERVYVSQRNTRVKLKEYESWAQRVVEQSLGPQVSITQKLKNKDLYTTEKRTRHGKCDHHMFRQMVDLAPQLHAALQAEIAAEGAARKVQSKRQVHQEDLCVLKAVEWCRELQQRAKRLRRAGIQLPPLPRFNRRRIEAHVRVQFRQHPVEGNSEELLLPEWLEAQYRVYPDESGFRQWLGDEAGEEVEGGEWRVEEMEKDGELRDVGCGEERAAPEEEVVEEETPVPTGCQPVAACPQEAVQNPDSHKGLAVEKSAKKPKSESDYGTVIPDDDENYAYPRVHSEHGYIRVLRTCKKTGHQEWIIPEKFQAAYDKYQQWLKMTGQDGPVIRLL